MQDYKQTFEKWSAFFAAPEHTKREVAQNINIEVLAGLDIVTATALEEIRLALGEQEVELYTNLRVFVAKLLKFGAFGGYMLHCIFHEVDPVGLKLAENQKLEQLGKIWLEEIQKDNGKGMYFAIDRIVMLMLEKSNQARINQIILAYPEIVHKSYNTVTKIEKFLLWAGVQGYNLGVLEGRIRAAGDIVRDISG